MPGALRASDAEIRRARPSMSSMIATYWMSFQRLSRAVASGAEDDPAGMHFEHAVSQVLALLAPYLHGPHRALVERLGARYLDDGDAQGMRNRGVEERSERGEEVGEVSARRRVVCVSPAQRSRRRGAVCTRAIASRSRRMRQ